MKFQEWVETRQFAGKSVAILGNGPSLNLSDPAVIRDRHDFIIGTNRTGPPLNLEGEPNPWHPILDWFMTVESAWLPKGDQRFAPHHAIYSGLAWKNPGPDDFIFRPGELKVGQTVARPAVHMGIIGGASEIHLYGVDCGYYNGRQRFTGDNRQTVEQMNNRGNRWRPILSHITTLAPKIKYVCHSPVANIPNWENVEC